MRRATSPPSWAPSPGYRGEGRGRAREDAPDGRAPLAGEAAGRSRGLARRAVGGGARDDLGREGRQGPHRPVAREDGRDRAARPDHRTRGARRARPGAPTGSGSPSRRSARATRTARSTCCPGRGRGPPPDERPDRGLGPEVVRGQPKLAFISRVWPDLASWDEQAKRQKERKDSKMTARTFDKPEIRYWDHWLDDRQAHVYSIGIEGGDPRAVTLGTGLELSRAEASTFSYDIAPDGTEVAFAADSDATGIDSNFDVYAVPVERGKARNLTSDNPAGDGSPAYSPDGRFIAFGRQVVKGFYADRTRLVLHDRAAGTNSKRVLAGVGPLDRHARLDAGLEGARRRDRRRRSRPRLPHRRRHGCSRGPHEGPHLLRPRPSPATAGRAANPARGLLRAAHAGAGGSRAAGSRRSSGPPTTSRWPGWTGGAM